MTQEGAMEMIIGEGGILIEYIEMWYTVFCLYVLDRVKG